MIVGAHSILYSTKPEADRAFLRDVLRLPHVDVGEGWLIFGLPPAEVAVHPSEENDVHEFYLMCSDAEAFVADMRGRGIECTGVRNLGWGLLTQITLPGGGKLGVYQPRHARPKAMGTRPAAPRRAKRPAKHSAPKAGARAAKRTTKRTGERTGKRTAKRTAKRTSKRSGNRGNKPAAGSSRARRSATRGRKR